MGPRVLQGQRGFTLVELLAVIAILTVLAGVVAAAVTGVGPRGQNARLAGDRDTLGKAADQFFNEAFPQAYPVVSCCKFVGDAAGTTAANADATPGDILEVGDLGVRLIDFETVLPGNPTKSFVPDFLKEVPDSAGLVSWRIVTATGEVFFAQDGTQLVRPSTARLDVSAMDTLGGQPSTNAGNKALVQSDYKFMMRMNKNEAALEILGMSIPAGYAIGGQSVAKNTVMGTLKVTLSSDNPWDPGQVLTTTTSTLKATGRSDEWELLVDYPDKVNNFASTDKVSARKDRTHKVSIALPSEKAAGAIKLELKACGDASPTVCDKAHNQATETWELTIYAHPLSDVTGAVMSGENVITNPKVKGVYRWLATQHTTIDPGEKGQELFSRVSGNQAVIIKEATTTTTTTSTTTGTTSTTGAVVPFSTTGDLYVLDQGSKNILRMTLSGAVSIAVTQAQIKAATLGTSVGFFNRGIAFDGAGTLYFTESVSGSILRRTSGGTLTVLTSKAAIGLAAGGAGDPKAIAFGSDGFLYVNDDASDSVLRVSPTTGAVSVHASKAALEAVPGVSSANLAGGIVGDAAGNIYMVSAPASGTQAVLKIPSVGSPSVLASGSAFSDLDVYITRTANGNLLVADDFGADTVHRVTPTGVVSTFLSKAALEAVAGVTVDLEAGIAFDSLGNFYLAESASDSILRFDTSLTGTVWVSKANIQAVTNATPDLQGGIAFAPG